MNLGRILLLPVLSIITLLIKQTHFLTSLLSLEIITLRLVVLISSITMNPTYRVLILTFGACEASFGLALLVRMSRRYGNDLLKNITVNKC